MNERLLEVIKQSVESRKIELENYDLNIENFRRAIAKIDSNFPNNPAMQEFRVSLVELLEQNVNERMKEQLMHDVLVDQLNEQ